MPGLPSKRPVDMVLFLPRVVCLVAVLVPLSLLAYVMLVVGVVVHGVIVTFCYPFMLLENIEDEENMAICCC